MVIIDSSGFSSVLYNWYKEVNTFFTINAWEVTFTFRSAPDVGSYLRVLTAARFKFSGKRDAEEGLGYCSC